MSFIRAHYRDIGAALLVIGVVLITLAEMPSMHWMRAFGAGALSVGAIGIGIWVGSARPKETTELGRRLAPLRTQIAALIVILTFLPALMGLAAALAGLISNPDGTGWVMAIGTLLVILLLVATVAALAITIQAILTVRAEVPETGTGDAE